MPVTVEKLPDEPIIVCTFYEPASSADYPVLWEKLSQAVEGVDGPIYRITDLSPIKITFGNMVVAIAEEAKSKMPGSAADPRIRSVLIATGTLIEFAAKSITQEQYGAIGVPALFTTLDEALSYCRSQIAKEDSHTD
jgi:hypothetical protein